MIEKTIIEYLDSMIGHVYAEQPEVMPSEFVLVEKTGGGMTDQIKRATIAVQSYAKTMLEAAELNEQIKDAMLGIVSLDEIASCRLNSDYNFTDTSQKRYRYQAVFDITHY